MNPSVPAFMDELVKIAEVETVVPAKKSNWPVVKSILKDIAAGAVGYGLGTGAGYAAQPLMQRLTRNMSPQRAAFVMQLPGVLGMLATMAARRAYQISGENLQDARRQRDNPPVRSG